MSINVTTLGSTRIADNVLTETGKSASTPSEANPPQTKLQSKFNASIIQASISVAIDSQNEPLALLLKSVITGINDILKPEFGENALQNAASQDNTPEGTAGRIVSISTGFFDLFKQQHVGEDEASVLKNFMATIRSGFEQGYKEARDILQGMGVFNGDIASNIGKTYELVKQGYVDFETAHSRPAGSQTSPQ